MGIEHEGKKDNDQQRGNARDGGGDGQTLVQSADGSPLIGRLARCWNGRHRGGGALGGRRSGDPCGGAAGGRCRGLGPGSRCRWRSGRRGGSRRRRCSARGQRRQFDRWRRARLGRQIDANRFFFRLNLDCFSRFGWNSARREIWIFSHSFLCGQARVGENSCQILNHDKKKSRLRNRLSWEKIAINSVRCVRRPRGHVRRHRPGSLRHHRRRHRRDIHRHRHRRLHDGEAALPSGARC